MESKENIICLIPARGGSKRLPRKNILDLAGKPVIAYTIEAALKCGLFKEVFVSTEDYEIEAVARKFGADVISRPDEMAGDLVRLVDLCLHTVEEFEKKGTVYDEICLLLPTTVLRQAEDIIETYRIFREGKGNFAVTVTEVPGEFNPYWTFTPKDGYLAEFVDGGLGKKRQELSEFFIANQAVNFARVDALKGEKTMVGSKCCYHVLPRERAVDIDTQFDFDIVKYFLNKQGF